MNEIPSIQWFPGHMTKTRRMMEKCLPLVDAVVEVIAARVPMSSRNPEINMPEIAAYKSKNTAILAGVA